MEKQRKVRRKGVRYVEARASGIVRRWRGTASGRLHVIAPCATLPGGCICINTMSFPRHGQKFQLGYFAREWRERIDFPRARARLANRAVNGKHTHTHTPPGIVHQLKLLPTSSSLQKASKSFLARVRPLAYETRGRSFTIRRQSPLDRSFCFAEIYLSADRLIIEKFAVDSMCSVVSLVEFDPFGIQITIIEQR